jgi:hypothetical protein
MYKKMTYTFNVSNVKINTININNKKKVDIKNLDIYKRDIAGEILKTTINDNLYKDNYENGFVGTLINCYNNHNNLIIRPDDIWIAILTQFSRYVNTNSEELRYKFVNFNGKKELIVFQSATLKTADYGSISKDIVTEISKNIINENMEKWIIPNFSTTNPNDIIIGSIIMMSSMQKYFNYTACLMCGIPKVTIMGEIEDWIEIKNRIKEILKYDTKDEYMKKWYNMLEPVIDNFIQSINKNPNIEWWNKICSHHGGGSGPRYISGWLSTFCVFSEEGIWLGDRLQIKNWNGTITSQWPIINTNNIPTGYVKVPLKIDDNGKTYDSIMVAGHIGYKINENNCALQPSLDWFIGLKDKN